MRVLNLSYDDYANYSYANMMALRSIDIDCLAMKVVPHIFGYAAQAEVATYDQMKEAISKADVIQFVHTNCTFFKHFEGLLKGKKVAVYHTGTIYRRQPESINNFYNPVVDISFTDHCEFMKLGAKNLHYMAVAINVQAYPHFSRSIKRPFEFAHYPSNPDVKGSGEIISMMKELNCKLSYSEKQVSHSEQIKRMSDCDIYIELFKAELEGKPYGHYGVTAFEAAAMGKVVVTQNIHKEVYLATYGAMPFQIANTKEDFFKIITGLINTPELQIQEMQTDSYAWMIQKHSYQATGRYLKSKLERL